MFMSEKFDPIRRFNERAVFYDRDVGKIIPGYGALHDTALHLLNFLLPPQARVLVVGAGTGNEAINYASHNPGWRITGLDIAEEMVKIAKHKVAKLWLQHRIKLVHGAVGDLFQESFDAATSLLVMHFIEIKDKNDFLNEIWLRLKPGARFILADITGDKNSDEFKTLLYAFESFQLEGRDKEEVRKRIKYIKEALPIITHEETIQLLENTGFRKIRLFSKSLLINGYIATKELI